VPPCGPSPTPMVILPLLFESVAIRVPASGLQQSLYSVNIFSFAESVVRFEQKIFRLIFFKRKSTEVGTPRFITTQPSIDLPLLIVRTTVVMLSTSIISHMRYSLVVSSY